VALWVTPPRTGRAPFAVVPERKRNRRATTRTEVENVSILWIILIVILVLVLLGFFSRGRW
jgi:flagellar basal body-associated protein FliL